MPVGVYRKKNKKGKFMYFRDGKLISKKSYDASTSRRRSTRKGGVRKTARRAYTNKRSNSKMKRTIPHPSVTGMASGLAIASYLNAGRTTSTATGTSMGTVTTMGEGVLKDITDGELGTAFNTLAGNAVGMIASEGGRKTLVTAGGVALLGAFARKQFPNLKLGGSKFYFRL
jgi:hypothetical protein